MQSTRNTLLGIAAVALTMGGASSAQTITGAVSGTVTDSTGAVIPKANVTVTNTATGVATSATTNDAGVYSIRFLQIGPYTTSIQAPGFQTYTTAPFNLEVGQTAKVDGHLAVEGAAQIATVESTLEPILNTEDSTIGTTLTANTIENIPLNGRNWSSLTLFLPGAVATNPGTFGGSGNQNAIERNQNGGGASQASINGNRAQGNNYRLDGIEINETVNNLVGYNPNPDALGEVRVISANAPAEYGNVNGGDVLAITKSGTNRFHGSVSGYLQNYNLDANTWLHKHKQPGTAFQPRDRYTQTQFSATFGGPIIKDKLFFFMDYFGTRYHSGSTSQATVLTQKMRTGDFSELLNPAIMCSATGGTCSPNQLIQLYDSLNGNTPYVGNLNVPIVNPAAKYLIAHPDLYPLPNQAPGQNSPVIDNYVAATKSNIHNDQGDIKIDYALGQKDRISGRWLQGEAGDFTSKALAIQFPSGSNYPDKGVALNYIHTFSPAVVNEFRAGYTRIRWEQGNPTDSTGVFGTRGNALIGIPGSQQFLGFSAQNIDGIQDANIGNAASGTNFINNTFIYGDNLTFQTGKHLLKAGAEFVRYQQNNFYPGNDGALGRFDYGQDNNGNNISFTSNPNITSTALPSAKGYAFADFVLDRVAYAGVGSVAGRSGQRQWRSAYFVQDDWKVMPNLTLNIGMRYEYFQPIYEVNNKQANIDYANKRVIYPGSIPAGAPAGSGLCATRACYNATYNNFMPRVGFAYQPTNRFVIRGGFGITKALEGTGANLRLTYNPPFQGSFQKTGTAPTTTSAGTAFTLEQGFSANPNYAGFYRSWTDLKPQQTNEYSLTTEYQVSNTASLTVGYVGELSQHLIQAISANQLTQPCIINGVVKTDYTIPACIAADPAPFLSLVGQGGFLFKTATQGNANFNALEVSYRQRQKKGLEYTVNYTYGRAMTNAVGFFGISGINGPSPYAQNAYDNAAEYGPAGSDVRHALNGTAVYAVPFGRGRAYGSNVNPLVDELLGGWKIAMTGVVYSGMPVTVSSSSVAGTGNRAARPNQVNNYRPTAHSINNWFGGDGLTAFTNIKGKYAAPTPGTYGNARVGSERGPGYQQYDFSAFKDFTVYHENKLGFRVDAFNLLNISSLSAPNNDWTSSNFGQITNVRSPQRQIQLSAKYQF